MNDTTYFRDYKPIEEDLGTKTNDIITATSTQQYTKNTPEKEQGSSLFDFFRKSSVGALYRVGAAHEEAFGESKAFKWFSEYVAHQVVDAKRSEKAVMVNALRHLYAKAM